MALKLKRSATIKRTIRVKIGSPEKADQVAHGSFLVNFRKPKMDELEELTRINRGEEESRLEPIRECLSKFVESVEGIQAEDGGEMSGDEQLEIVLNEAEFAIPTHVDFWRFVNSLAEVKKGN